MGVLASISIVSVAALIAGMTFGETTVPLAASVSVGASAPTQEPALSVLFAGDTLLGDAAQWYLDSFGYRWTMWGVQDLLDAQFTIVNAEGPLTERIEPWDAAAPWSYNSLPAAARALAESGVGALTLANNHSFDRGPEGLLDTLAHARQAGLATVGAGQDLAEAQRPLLVRNNVGTVGIVALADVESEVAAGEARPGLADLDPTAVAERVSEARRAGADWVVALVHWGENYAGLEGQQRATARLFAAAGYDLMVGYGAHLLQPIEIVDSMPVVYSLGNFVFGSPGRFRETDTLGYGGLLTAEFGAQGLERLRLRCIVTDNDVVKYQPRRCTPPEALQAMTGLHPELVVGADGVGWLDLRQPPAPATASVDVVGQKAPAPPSRPASESSLHLVPFLGRQ